MGQHLNIASEASSYVFLAKFSMILQYIPARWVQASVVCGLYMRVHLCRVIGSNFQISTTFALRSSRPGPAPFYVPSALWICIAQAAQRYFPVKSQGEIRSRYGPGRRSDFVPSNIPIRHTSAVLRTDRRFIFISTFNNTCSG